MQGSMYLTISTVVNVEEFYFLGYNAMYHSGNQLIFLGNISPPYSAVISQKRNHICLLPASCKTPAYYSTLKMKVTCSLVDFHHNSQRFA
jgi:hypothetical protein